MNYIIWCSWSSDPTSTLQLREKYSRLESKFWCIKIHLGNVTLLYIFGQILISYCKFLMARPLNEPYHFKTLERHFFTLNDCLFHVLITGESNFDERNAQPIRGSLLCALHVILDARRTSKFSSNLEYFGCCVFKLFL